MQYRQPAVAGLFYPDEPEVLRQDILDYLASSKQVDQQPKAIIVPHAGYIYSGPIAATAYRTLQARHNKIKRVVLLGPSHRVPLLGMATSSDDCFITPLGNIELDKEAIRSILELPDVHMMDQPHLQEHSLEVQLPFLQTVLDDFKLVPIVVGEADARTVANVIEHLWGGDETLIVISSDLSHFHSYDEARSMDRHTSDAIENLDGEQIGYDDACGRNPVKGLLLAAKHHDLHASTVDLRNSGDTAGPRNQVVGYGAYLFS